ncbi:MAG: transposase [Candidatus Binataceae bacterium]
MLTGEEYLAGLTALNRALGGLIVTTLAASSRAVVRFYNKPGTAEQWIKEGKQALAMTRLSCHCFRAKEVRL